MTDIIEPTGPPANADLSQSLRQRGVYALPLSRGLLADVLALRFTKAVQVQARRAAEQSRLWYQLTALLPELTDHVEQPQQSSEPITPISLAAYLRGKETKS